VRIRLNPSALRRTKWYEYGVRFLFGGTITALAGIIAKEAGPVFGGLFLAFPAILPATATLIAKHEEQKKQGHGLDGARRGREVAGVAAIGAAIGSVGLIAFAMWTWRFLPRQPSGLVLTTATIIWFCLSLLVWYSRKLVPKLSNQLSNHPG
jgi:hypothetical protein